MHTFLKMFEELDILYFDILFSLLLLWGTRCRSWLRRCATSQKVAGLISDDVTGVFH
jgi:hypothetical protein